MEFVVDGVGEIEEGLVDAGAARAGLELEAVLAEVGDGEGLVSLPVEEAFVAILDGAVAEEDFGGALGVVLQDVGEAQEAGEKAWMDDGGEVSWPTVKGLNASRRSCRKVQ